MRATLNRPEDGIEQLRRPPSVGPDDLADQRLPHTRRDADAYCSTSHYRPNTVPAQ